MNTPNFTRRVSGRLAARLSRLSERPASAIAGEPASLASILITDKLKSRRRRKPNSHFENAALHTLARVMATAPDELVDTLLRSAIELCSAGTAGLSLLETPENGEQIFRWTNVAGVLSKHVGGSTPRNFSPCGVTLNANAPQLFAHPESRFQYFAKTNIPFVEALVIPVYLGGETPGTIWIVSHDDEVKFDSEDVRIMTGLAEFTGCALQLTQLSAMQRAARLAGDKEIAEHKLTEEALRNTQSKLKHEIEIRTGQLRQLSVKLMNMQDEERRRIARELHDSAGQYLAGIQMNLNALLSQSTSLAGSDKSRISDSLAMADHCQSEIRTISYLLHPPLLDETGLRSALAWYVAGFAERSGIEVQLQIPDGFGRLPSDTETAMFRVIQQSLANIHRHSGSKVARIAIDLKAEDVSLEICDEGAGIPHETLMEFHSGTRLPGVGMAGMRERVRDMGGRFDIHSSAGGTKIQINLPLAATPLSPKSRGSAEIPREQALSVV
jgi:signal transduction histidine kinase